jgi:hypothetical protein
MSAAGWKPLPKRHAATYGRSAIEAHYSSDRLLVEIIQEISRHDALSADERLRIVGPYQAELARRVRARSQ